MTINAFVKTDDYTKQVPLVFALMSGKKTKDYKAVIKAVLEMLPVPPAVRKITVDFEMTVWKTLRELMPNVDIMGCVFHWTQALWRRVCQRFFVYYTLKKNLKNIDA